MEGGVFWAWDENITRCYLTLHQGAKPGPACEGSADLYLLEM